MKGLITKFVMLCGVGMFLLPGLARTQELGDPRDVVVEAQAVNDHPAFAVRVSVDHEDRIYYEGDEMTVMVRSEKKGYLYLFYCNAEKKVSCLFPNEVQSDNLIPAGQTVTIPSEDMNFKLRIRGPLGREVLKAIVTNKQLDNLDPDSLKKGKVTKMTLKQIKDVFVEVSGGASPQDEQYQQKRKEKAGEWAEHQVEITTMARGKEKPRPQGKFKRVGMFVGISEYQCEQIPQLNCSHKDAETIAQVMQETCQLDEEPLVLLNSKATLKNIEQGVRKRLVSTTQPGDTVFLYWSGHGGRCSDDNGDEKDGYDEYLVPHDGQLKSIDAIRQSMLLDDTMGRWIQELDGRKVVVILDTCHSGGQSSNAPKKIGAAKGVRGVKKVDGAKFAKAAQVLDGAWGKKKDGKLIPYKKNMLQRELKSLQLVKDIGQQQDDVAVLTSSQAGEVSYERKEQDLSVMTFYLVDYLKQNNGEVTVPAAAKHLSTLVPQYVSENFTNGNQTPLLVDKMSPPAYIRP